MAAPITIYLIDDEAIVRAGLRALLAQSQPFEVLGETGDPRHGIEEVARLQPDVVVLDVAMPGLSGIDAIAPLKRAAPKTKVLMASHHEAAQFVLEALEAGADGYLSKASDPDELIRAVAAIARGEAFLSSRVAGSLVLKVRKGNDPQGVRSKLDVLTPREREVFQLLAVGRTNKDVAAELDLSLGTVKKHRENLQRKLHCHSPAELARLAIREGLLDV